MPRFTIRTLLAILTISAIAFVMVGTAYRGQYWAWGVTIGLISVIVTAFAHAAWFGTVWLFAHMTSAEHGLRESAFRPTMTSLAGAGGSASRDGERLLSDGHPER